MQIRSAGVDVLLGLVIVVFSVCVARANGFTVRYSFKGGNDGALPAAGLAADSAGNLYGTTLFGGSDGQGTVFRLTSNGTETVLYSFKSGGQDGGDPVSRVVLDKKGNIYGTTTEDGGTVFRLTPTGTEKVLHQFVGDPDGNEPEGALIRVSRVLYGTTYIGGTHSYTGTVYSVTPRGAETILYSFADGNDGSNPRGSLIADGAGNLYGVTEFGGSNSCNTYGCGTVFKLTSDGAETVLHSFTGNDGTYPTGSLKADSSGNFYGTTANGGSTGCNGPGCGTIFKITPSGTLTTLYVFKGGSDDCFPNGGLVMDISGNLYGTTVGCISPATAGIVFKFSSNGTFSTLYTFTGGSDGDKPYDGLLLKAGILYGTTYEGGANGAGVVFSLDK